MTNENLVEQSSGSASQNSTSNSSDSNTRTKASIFSALGVGGVAVGCHIGPGFASEIGRAHV